MAMAVRPRLLDLGNQLFQVRSYVKSVRVDQMLELRNLAQSTPLSDRVERQP